MRHICVLWPVTIMKIALFNNKTANLIAEIAEPKIATICGELVPQAVEAGEKVKYYVAWYEVDGHKTAIPYEVSHEFVAATRRLKAYKADPFFNSLDGDEQEIISRYSTAEVFPVEYTTEGGHFLDCKSKEDYINPETGELETRELFSTHTVRHLKSNPLKTASGEDASDSRIISNCIAGIKKDDKLIWELDK